VASGVAPGARPGLRLASALAGRYRTILYRRPLVPGLNDTPRHLRDAVELSKVAHATVFTGLFYRGEIATYYQANHLPEPYGDTARRKIVPETLEQRVLDAFSANVAVASSLGCGAARIPPGRLT
jgi:hypothetical protein